MKLINFYLRYFFFIFFFFPISSAFSNNIEIEGLSKLTIDDIQSITEIDIKRLDLSFDEIDTIVADLYNSELIDNVSLSFNNSIAIIFIRENSIVENIYINGNVRLKDNLILNNLSQKVNFYLNSNKIINDINIIKDIYASSGHLNTYVNTYTEKYSDNRVNLVYEINEGPISVISNVDFIGNSTFSDKFLYSRVSTKSLSAFNIFTSGSNFISKNFEFDQEKLTLFYKQKGFFDIAISYQLKEIRNSKYSLVYYVNEGDRYKVDSIQYIYDSNINDLSIFDEINNDFKIKINKNDNYFDYDLVDNYIDEFNKNLINSGFYDLSITHNFTLKDDGKRVLEFNSIKADPLFVKKINIYGNSITKDKTIRSKLNINPGDYLNTYKITRLENNINRLTYINDIKITPGEIIGNSADLILEIDENKKTGSFLLGATYSGDVGAGFAFNLKDTNFLGGGNEIDLQFTGNQEKALYTLNYSTFSPYNAYITHNYSISNQELDLSGSYGYKTKTQSIGYNISLQVNENTRTSIGLIAESLKGYDPIINALEVNDNIGKFNQGILSFDLNYDTTNKLFFPTSGIKNNLNFSFSPDVISDDSYYKLSLNNKNYKEIKDSDNYFFLINNLGVSERLNGNLKTNSTYSLGGLNFKGFDYRGIGPVSNNNIYLGGNNFFTTTVGYGGSFLFDEKDNINLKAFYTSGSLWNSDYSDDDKFALRSSIGLSLDFLSAVGPISLSYSIPIQKQNEDKSQNFNFSLGASF